MSRAKQVETILEDNHHVFIHNDLIVCIKTIPKDEVNYCLLEIFQELGD